MKVKVPIPGLTLRCCRCKATTEINHQVRPGSVVSVHIDCECPSERPELEWVHALPAGHYAPPIPLVVRAPSR